VTADEIEIRKLVSTWLTASKAGDLDTVLGLMTEDVIFLRPGHEPMIGKASYAAASAPPSGAPAPQINGNSEIQEVQVFDDVAFLWSRLTVTITPPGGSAMKSAGHTLTVFKKQNGKWLLARDANMLTELK
jgi:uncharacterized protein (TIGR02246 family)